MSTVPVSGPAQNLEQVITLARATHTGGIVAVHRRDVHTPPLPMRRRLAAYAPGELK
jgi:hypothetical protein